MTAPGGGYALWLRNWEFGQWRAGELRRLCRLLRCRPETLEAAMEYVEE